MIANVWTGYSRALESVTSLVTKVSVYHDPSGILSNVEYIRVTWNQIESKLAVAAGLFIVLFFVGTILVLIADEYDDAPLYASRRQERVEVNQAPKALKPQSNERESQIEQSPAHEPVLNTQSVRSPRQGLAKIYDDPTMANNRVPSETSLLAILSPQRAVHPATPVGRAIEEEKRKVLQSIEMWRTAWQAQDVDAYVTHYIDTFQPANGHSHQAWLQDRKIKLTRAEAISVHIEHLQVERLDDQRWKATFRQRYQSNTYADKVTKELLLIKVGDQYLIEKEQVW